MSFFKIRFSSFRCFTKHRLPLVLVTILFCCIVCQTPKDSLSLLEYEFNNHSQKAHLYLDTLQLDKLTDDQFLERIQFDYTRNCLKDKDSVAIVENDGYRINLFCVAIKNNWISRATGARAVLEYLREFENAKTVKGFFPRTFSRKTGDHIPGEAYWTFGYPYDVVGTAFLITSTEFVIKPFFDRNNETESEIRRLCNVIFDRVNWDFAYLKEEKCFTWFKNGDDGEVYDGKRLAGEMDETFFLQFLALSSNNWSYGREAYDHYISKIFIDNQYGYKYFSTKEHSHKISPQFTGVKVNNPKNLALRDYPTAKLGYLTQSHIWFDFRGYYDAFNTQHKMSYFEGVQNAVKAQIRYATINPGQNKLYGDVWGFYDTYSPISKKWMTLGLPAEGDSDEGTISISAVMSAMPFAPEETIKCLRTLYQAFKKNGIYKKEGFMMSVNTNTGEPAPRPGSFFMPISVLSIENYRSELIWKLAKSNPKYHKSFTTAGLEKK